MTSIAEAIAYLVLALPVLVLFSLAAIRGRKWAWVALFLWLAFLYILPDLIPAPQVETHWHERFATAVRWMLARWGLALMPD